MSIQLLKCPLCDQKFFSGLTLHSHMDKTHCNLNNEEKEMIGAEDAADDSENYESENKGSPSEDDDSWYTSADICAILRYLRRREAVKK